MSRRRSRFIASSFVFSLTRGMFCFRAGDFSLETKTRRGRHQSQITSARSESLSPSPRSNGSKRSSFDNVKSRRVGIDQPSPPSLLFIPSEWVRLRQIQGSGSEISSSKNPIKQSILREPRKRSSGVLPSPALHESFPPLLSSPSRVQSSEEG